MSLEIAKLSTNERAVWNDALDRTDERTPFHRFEALEVFAAHSGAEFHPLVGYKGQEEVGLFPLFTLEKGPITTAFSPPPNLKVSYLGPVLLTQPGMKANTVERRRQRFISACIDWLDETHAPRYVHVRTAITTPDTRPFDWELFEETPRFTYVVDLDTGPETLFDRFSRDARSNVREAEAACSVSLSGRDAARRIIEQVKQRHDEQDIGFPVTPELVDDLYDVLPDGHLRPYVCTIDGEFAGGSLVLDDGERAYGWQGTVKQDIEYDINDLLHWEIIRDAAGRGVRSYDLVGANNPRLSRYKSKFAPTLTRYHSLERSATGFGMMAQLYRRLQ
ncbi:GNAT family N-acetyltransferase [Haloarcula nitratireducens]|uniref:GNAT family N-acetyltransferase n=1 Tax=Haloarcula nitratireducens TaxID=2487749 RepID=A0AAW4P8P8_9EURY|nr:GNAT family N-acetyltransferase [Halomicroarcula nitratireducens]MBX0294040.1 GNAT family N-acetyltransferase [Halomicroarcula nitratireducens]